MKRREAVRTLPQVSLGLVGLYPDCVLQPRANSGLLISRTVSPQSDGVQPGQLAGVLRLTNHTIRRAIVGGSADLIRE
jgi:hypothetical protein